MEAVVLEHLSKTYSGGKLSIPMDAAYEIFGDSVKSRKKARSTPLL